jgi:hypothetical protein
MSTDIRELIEPWEFEDIKELLGFPVFDTENEEEQEEWEEDA